MQFEPICLRVFQEQAPCLNREVWNTALIKLKVYSPQLHVALKTLMHKASRDNFANTITLETQGRQTQCLHKISKQRPGNVHLNVHQPGRYLQGYTSISPAEFDNNPNAGSVAQHITYYLTRQLRALDVLTLVRRSWIAGRAGGIPIGFNRRSMSLVSKYMGKGGKMTIDTGCVMISSSSIWTNLGIVVDITYLAVKLPTWALRGYQPRQSR